MRWVETRDGSRRVIMASLPVLLILGVYLLLQPVPGVGRVLGGVVLGTAGLVFLVRLTALGSSSDPALAIPVASATAVAVVGLLTALVVISGEASAAVGLALVLVVAGVFILSAPAVVVVGVAAHVGFIVAVLRHGSDTGWILAGAGLITSVALAGLAHHRQLHVLKATLRLQDRESRHNQELEDAFNRARDAELKAKRLTESASEGIRAQREREALRSRMQSILDSAGEGIVGTDPDGKVMFVNQAAARLTGHREDAMVGKDLHGLIHHSKTDGSPYPVESCPVHQVIQKRRVRKVEGESFWRSDGSSFPVSFVASPLMEEGKVKGAVLVFQDITQRTEVEKMKDELVSVVSHELRTPLTSIHGSLMLLTGTMKERLPKKAVTLVDMASRNTQRLIRLVNDLLDLERLRAGGFEIQTAPVGAREIADEVVASLEGFAVGHDVRLSLQGQDVTLVVDSQRIHQALVNLVSNAVKFSPPKGVVSVSTEHDGRHVWFSVTDQGPGIERSMQKRLFQRFSQLDAQHAKKNGGSGLGLAITRGIVEAHGGRVGLVSEPGRGSTFYFMLPLQGRDQGGDGGKDYPTYATNAATDPKESTAWAMEPE